MLEARMPFAASILFIALLASANEAEGQQIGAEQESKGATESPPGEEEAGNIGAPDDDSKQGPAGVIDVRTWPPQPINLPDEEIAFRIKLRGQPMTPVLISMKSWNEQIEHAVEVYAPPDRQALLQQALSARLKEISVRLFFHEEVPELRATAREIRRKLDRGILFERLVRQYSKDDVTRQNRGRLGQMTRTGWRYPLDIELFDAQTGDIVGPFWTEWGVEFYRIDDRGGEPRTRSEWLDVSQILITYWEPGAGFSKSGTALRRLEISSPHLELTALISPAMLPEWPKSFGPTDLAPIGDPWRKK